MAKKVIKRAEMNMKMGRSTNFPALKHQLVRALASSSFQNKIAQFFTMRGPEAWWI